MLDFHDFWDATKGLGVFWVLLRQAKSGHLERLQHSDYLNIYNLHVRTARYVSERYVHV